MPTVVRIRGGGFALVNLPVVLVYSYGRGSCHLDFCVDVCLPDRLWARASVPLWWILLLAGMVGFTRLYACSSWFKPGNFDDLFIFLIFDRKVSLNYYVVLEQA